MDIGIFGAADSVGGLESQVRYVADQGFSSFWTPQGFDIDALTALAVVGAKVDNIRLGTSVVPTYPRHPMMMAQQALTVNQVSGGRLNLGIGLSHKVVVEDIWGISFDRPVRHMTEYLNILRPLLRGEKVDYRGETLTTIGQTPLDSESPPVLLAAMGEQMLRLAGRLTDGTITWMTGPTTLAELTVPTISDAAAGARNLAPQIIASVPVSITDDESQLEGRRAQAAKELAMYGYLPSYRVMLDREGHARPEDFALIGDLQTVEAGLKKFVDAGATSIIAAPLGGREDQEATIAALSALTK